MNTKYCNVCQERTFDSRGFEDGLCDKCWVVNMRNELYAVSPFNLGSVNDNKYREAIDSVIQ